MTLEYNGQRIGAMQYNGVTIGEAMIDGQTVYRSVIRVTPVAPTFHDGEPWYTLPTVEGVTYSVSGTPGYSQTVTVTATAQKGYELVGTSSWTRTYGPPPRYSVTWSGGAFTAIRNAWQNVVFIDITERSRTSGEWAVGWNAPSTSSCSVRVLVGDTVIASTGPTVFGLTSRVIQPVAIPETDLYPGDRLNFQLLTDGSTVARRSVYLTRIALG